MSFYCSWYYSNSMSEEMMDKKEIKFSKILVAADGSEASNHAVDYAIEIARKYNSDLTALHVILSDVTLFGSVPPAHMNEIKNEAQKYLDKIREKYYKSNDNKSDDNNNKQIQLRTELITSASAVGGILGFAEKENIDLIVIGTRGRSGFKKLLLGSVASGVVTYAHCPVLVIK
jgi:nucleotide-binding universal stress UspA family protein